jgi:membrane protein involved in colicin uptake
MQLEWQQQQQHQLVHSKPCTGQSAQRQRLQQQQVQQFMRLKQDAQQRLQQLVQRQQQVQQQQQQQQHQQQQVQQPRFLSCEVKPQEGRQPATVAELEDWHVNAQLYQLLQQADAQATGTSAAAAAAASTAGNCHSVMNADMKQQQQHRTALCGGPALGTADDSLVAAMLIAQGGLTRLRFPHTLL